MVVLGISAFSVKVLVWSVVLVQHCVPSVMHRLEIRTLAWRLFIVTAHAHRAPILTNNKAFA